MSTTTDSAPEHGFEPALFWELHKKKILAYALLVAAAIVAYSNYQISANRKAALAESLLATATKADDYRKVIAQFPGSMPAANAALLLAADLRKTGKFEESVTLLRNFLETNPQHPLAGGAALSLGETLQAQGKTNEALAAFQTVTSKYANSYSAPLSMLYRASLLKSTGKNEEAVRVYETLLAQYPQSLFAAEARELLRQIK